MRRSFNKKLLPKEAPSKKKKPYVRRASYKTNQKRCNDLEILMQDYKEQVGDRFSLPELARLCGVLESTARRWFYGFPPSHLCFWIIARYFERHLDIDAQIIKTDIEDTIKEWREGK